jgi:hypothetical protein
MATNSTVMLELAAESIAPTRAREALEPLANQLPQHKYEDVALLVTVLVTRAVTQTSTPAVVVKVSIDRGYVRGLVATAQPPGSPVRVPDETAEVLGRQLLDAIATRWSADPHGTETWFEIAPDGPA